MSITINATKKAEIDARLAEISPEKNGEALDTRQREAVKDEVATLVDQGKTDEAISKLLELI